MTVVAVPVDSMWLTYSSVMLHMWCVLL